ncbi:MAG: GPW/gp25 family protein [Chloroflexi bacterium]|jgi:phage baseplate assembly protein W|nr:GPW/gp25 family protein [Anaerolineaceae bacterium]NMB88214.1 GPW/gp25 family protein [Chloroflexota bacterium]
MPENSRTAYLGRGLHFPIRVNPLGSVELVSAEKDIEQSIAIILGTRRGERVMRPEFGCQAHDLLFEPRDAVLASKLRDDVSEALARWEPRIQVIDVRPELDGDADGAVLVYIDYQVKSSHDQRSIVYPFFIERQEEW